MAVCGERQARELSERLDDFIRRDGRRGMAFYARPDNEGARITVTED